MTFDILLTLFLVFLNGFFVAAEFAIVKVRSSQIALQAGNSSKRAAQIIIDNLDGFLAATQLGITLASLGLGWVGEDVVSKMIISVMHSFDLKITEEAAHNISIPIAFATLTVLHIVFGELAPKSLAIRYPTSTTLSVSIPLRVFYFIFKPFIRLLNGLANLILRPFGIRPVSEQDIHSEEELKLIIAESEEGGAIESSERELIQNVFDFDDRIVKQVMVPRIKISGINSNVTLDQALQIVMKEGYSRYPIYDHNLDEIKGILHGKDIIFHYINKTNKSLLEIAHQPYFVTENKPIDHLLREFQKKKVQMAIVISEYGGTIGIVTMEDIIEELVGEIQDEHDHEAQIVTQHDNMYQVIATSSIHDINKVLDEPFPESEDYDTLAGLLLLHKPFDLREGEEFDLDGYHVKIVKMNKTLPEIVELRTLPKSEEEAQD
ncbi:hemolysin family protein [Pseudochryseolinea flava]|uniref:Hemolysin n=1 Tax=Pseudochryseolinea flava TaxID=2059302 RepID=A0A364YAL1_9BACT|nr:hemolysin family protein [Pseudochryseolinea flava]RAW03415.1 hemolysin [Pseudochryseolinea flava]